MILSATYGIDVAPKNDPLIAIAEKGMHAMAMTGNAGSYLGKYMVPSYRQQRDLIEFSLQSTIYLPVSASECPYTTNL